MNHLTPQISKPLTTIVKPDLNSEMKECGVFIYGDTTVHYNILRKASRQSNEQSSICEKVTALKTRHDAETTQDTITTHGAEKIQHTEKKKQIVSRAITIKVHSDQRIVAIAPHDVSKKIIHEAVMKNARWIWKHLTAFSSQQEHVLPKEYISGETQFYLGKRYMLKIMVDTKHITNVKLNRGKLLVTLSHDNNRHVPKIKILLDSWYLYRAKTVFQKYLKELLPKTIWVQDLPVFRLMTMKKQWGSCSKQGALIFNPHLVKASRECIEYVMLHELCHLAEHNHSERFWCLLAQVMPNWKEVKAKLDDRAELYLNG